MARVKGHPVVRHAPAPRMDLANDHVRYRIQYSASCHLLRISTSRPTSEDSRAWSTPTGMCRLLLTTEASNSTMSKGVDFSLRGSEDLHVEFYVPSSLCDGVIVEVRVELGLCKDYKHISSQQLATSMPTRSPEHKKITMHNVPASRVSNVDQSAVPSPGLVPESEPSDPTCSSEVCQRPPGQMSDARRHRRLQNRRCTLTGTSMKGLRES